MAANDELKEGAPVWHTASKRAGTIVERKRRFGTEGAYVDFGGSCVWVPIEVLETEGGVT